MHKTTCTYEQQDKTRDFRFVHADSSGRESGCIVSTGEVRFEDFEPDAGRSYCTMEAGLYQFATVQQTRNGRSFGATQSRKYFATTGERDAYINKRLADSKKAAAKRAGK